MRRGFPAALATATVFLVALAVVGLAGAIIIPPVIDELGVLGEAVRSGIEEVGATVASGPFGVTEAQLQDAIDSGVERLQESGGTIGSGILSGAVIVTEILAGFLIALVLVFFFVKDGDGLWAWIVRQFPRRRRATVDAIGVRTWEILSGYVRGLTIVAVFDAVLIAIALLIIGVPLVLPLAVITFLAAYVPIVGAVTAGALAALVALVSQGFLAAVLVVVAITIIQQIESDVLHPLVVGKSVALHPVSILLAVATGVVLAGIIGALVAVPLTAVVAAAVPIVRRGATERPSEPTD
jgi:predicted PurR-regulated permease PerM